MYKDTITLFNRKEGNEGDTWYPTVLRNVNLNMDRAAILAKYGAESADSAVLHIRYKQVGDDKVRALDHATLHIKPHEFVSIIGPSGSGKSTFLRCLNMLEKPDSGEIIFAGEDLTAPKANLNLHRQKMGMVFQQFNLFPHMTVLENLTCAPLMLGKMNKTEAEAMAMDSTGMALACNGVRFIHLQSIRRRIY